MRRFLAVAAFAALFSVRAYAAETCSKTSARPNGELPACLALDAVTQNTSSAVIDTFGYKFLSLYVWSSQAAGVTSARVLIECRSYSPASGTTSAWLPCAADIVDPDDNALKTRTDQAVTLSRAYQYRISVTGYAAGDVSAIVERFTDK